MSMTKEKKKNRNEGFKDKHRAADPLVIAHGEWSTVLVRTMAIQSLCRNSKAAGEGGTLLPLSHLMQHLGCNFFTPLTQI